MAKKTPRKSAVAMNRLRDPQGKFKCNLPAAFAPHADVPHLATFVGLPMTYPSAYRTSDQALRDNPGNAAAMRKDVFLMECLRARQYATCLSPWEITSPNEDLDVVYVRDKVEEIVKKTPQLTEMLRNLLESIWFGRYGINMEYSWRFDGDGTRWMVPCGWTPIDGDKIRYTNDQRIAIHWGSKVDPNIDEVVIFDRARARVIPPHEREALIVMNFEREDGDYIDQQSADRVHGVGIRDRLYWYWNLKNQLLGWLIDTFERFGRGGGIQLWFFEQGNDASYQSVKQAAETQSENSVLLVPRPAGQEKQTHGLEIVTPDSGSLKLMIELMSNYFDGAMKRYIVGQEMTSEASPSGLGSELAKIQQNSFHRIIKYDASLLSETITEQFVKVVLRHNFPEYADLELAFNIITDEPDQENVIKSLQAAYEMGLSLSEDDVRTQLSIVKPTSDEAVVKKSAEPLNTQSGLPQPAAEEVSSMEDNLV